jgi:DNA-binding MarR family transcriptional regulator
MPAKPDLLSIADRLHSGAIRMLRRVRVADAETELSAPKLSALSVLVFAGPVRLTDLAAAEQVRAPTMSKLAAELERDGLAVKRADAKDGRSQRIAATAKGKALMEEGRRRRLALLKSRLATLSVADQRRLDAAADLLLKLSEGER